MNMRFEPDPSGLQPAGFLAGDVEDVADSLDVDMLRRYVSVLRHKLSPGQSLYHVGQPFKSVFLVHAGFLKTIELADDGREQITGFRMRGDFLGIESIGLTSYACGAVSLESAEVWELPYPAILSACQEIPQLQVRLTAALAQEIRADHAWMLVIGTLNAEQRVATFLLDVARRYARLGFSARHFVLRMRRADIASFLALTNETVCRVMTKLHDLRMISVARREIHVLDAGALHALASQHG